MEVESLFPPSSPNFTENTTFLPLPPFSYPPLFHYLAHVIFGLIFIVAILGNLLVIIVVFTQKKMRTSTNYLISNLALGDLFSTLLCLPFGYISILYQSWPFGFVLCQLVTPLQCLFVFLSAWTLVLLSLERWWGVVRWERRRWSKKVVGAAVGGVWVGSGIISLPVWFVVGISQEEGGIVRCEETTWPTYTLRHAYTLSLIILQYFLPVGVILFTYFQIVVEVFWKKDPLLDTGSGGGGGGGTGVGGCCAAKSVREERMERARRRTIFTLLLVVSTYSLCWLPLNLLYLYLEVIQTGNEEPFQHFEYYFLFSHFCSMTHTCFNPLIYAWVNERFREGFAQVLRVKQQHSMA